MKTIIVLEWEFSPPDILEEPIEEPHEGHTMSIADGKAVAKIDSSIFDADSELRQRLHDTLNDKFLAMQLCTHRAYRLSRSTVTRVHPDGRRDIFIEPNTGRVEIAGGRPDIKIKGADGKVTFDSKRDRIEKAKTMMGLISTHRPADILLPSLLRIHTAAVNDPDNELVYLYEIRDALVKEFGGDRATRTALGICRTDWSRFGQLCNDEPLRQGRHRGKTMLVLRDATEVELQEARGVALAMIEAYVRHLENSAG